MPGLNEILGEVQRAAGSQPPVDPAFFTEYLRRKYLAELAAHSGRHTILYASRWLQGVPQGAEPMVAIGDDDVHALMTTIQGSNSKKLDLVLHSPGGSPEAAESIVSYLRGKFTDDIRVIVPHLAMSAATMIACAADRVILGRHSWLGPTDPQITLQTPVGLRFVAAQAILEQFRQARQDCQTDAGLRAWAPILPQYGPDLLVLCENASALTTRLVKKWLRDYMFRKIPKRARQSRVNRLAGFLTDHSKQHTHGRHLDRQSLRSKGMEIDDMEADPRLQDLVLSVYHATVLSFTISPGVIKIVENHTGRGIGRVVPMQGPAASPTSPQTPPPAPPPPT